LLLEEKRADEKRDAETETHPSTPPAPGGSKE